jgi:hypothetical protein
MTFELGAVTGRAATDSGVEHGDPLVRVTEAVVGWDHPAVMNLRAEGEACLGAGGFLEAIAVASGFNGINRVADGIGIPLDDRLESLDAVFWDTTGIRDFEEQGRP